MIFSISILTVIGGCERDDDLVAITSFITLEPEITLSGIQTGGLLETNKDIEITEYGVCYSTSENPDINDMISPGTDMDITEDNNSYTIEFTSHITLLTSGTTYYIVAFVTTPTGTAYGNQVEFTAI
ncbi:MAG: hypothetical protein ACLFQA_01110 [Bacteroidales bacterium]